LSPKSLPVVVAAVLALAVSGTAGASRTLVPRKPCGTISGPKWTFLKGPESGTKYGLVAIGTFSCASAKHWVAKLTADHVKNKTSSIVSNNVLKNGPKGYACAAHSSKEGLAFAGECLKGPKPNPTSGFSWSGTP
jgi:hypothetical protein